MTLIITTDKGLSLVKEKLVHAGYLAFRELKELSKKKLKNIVTLFCKTQYKYYVLPNKKKCFSVIKFNMTSPIVDIYKPTLVELLDIKGEVQRFKTYKEAEQFIINNF